MKKPILIGLIILAAIVTIGGITLGIITAFNLSEISNSITLLEETKVNCVLNAENSFDNTVDKFDAVKLDERDVSKYEHVFIKDDIYFLSTVKEWDDSMLAHLSEELYKNKHGEEIKYVYSVILYPNKGEPYIGTYEKLTENFDIPLSLYNFLPKELFFDFASDLSEISLYDADYKTTVDEMAVTLSHEYGHHFAEYHFGLGYGKKDRNTEYYEIRSQGTTDIRLEKRSFEDYLNNHMWFLGELAAEDYVYIMGSEKAHRILEFYDVKDSVKAYAKGGIEAADALIEHYGACRNGIPHENMALPLPDDVEGLVEFFYSFTDDEAPETNQVDNLGTLNLQANEKRKSRYHITWDQPYEDEDVIYTLICYFDDDELFSVLKTTRGNQTGEAYFGSYTYGRFYYTTSIPDDFPLKFRVTVTFPDGHVEISDAIEIEF